MLSRCTDAVTVYGCPTEACHGGRLAPTRWRGTKGFLDPLPLPINKALHQPVRLVGKERPPEYADAEVDGFLERQFFPLAEQRFLRTQRFRTAFEQGFNRALDPGIEAPLPGDPVRTPP